MNRSGFAVVLGGGGGLGAFEIGVIDAMARNDLRPDLLVGSSVGALNAAFWALAPSRNVGVQLLQAWLGADRVALFSERPWRWLRRLLTHHDHLFGHAAETNLISSHFGPQTRIEETSIPLAIVATELGSGSRLLLRSGNLATALLASIAIPGLFAPVEVDGSLLVDGGVVANCDLEAVAEAGISRAVVVDPIGTYHDDMRGDMVSQFEHAVAISLRRQTDLAIRALGDLIEIVLLRPQLSWTPQLLDFSHTRELFEMGRVSTEHYLASGNEARSVA